MKKHLLGILITLCAVSAPAMAQSTDYPKWEFYGGYMRGQNVYSSNKDNFDFGGGATQTVTFCSADGIAFFGENFDKVFCKRNGFNGFNGAVTRKFTRYLGVVGDFSWQRRTAHSTDTLSPAEIEVTDITETKFMAFGGLQIKDSARDKRIKPFGHVMAGFAHEKLSGFQTDTLAGNTTFSDQPNSFAMKIGGGLDVRLNRRLDLRAIEVDYTPLFARDRALKIDQPFTVQVVGRTANNVSFGVGLVIH